MKQGTARHLMCVEGSLIFWGESSMVCPQAGKEREKK